MRICFLVLGGLVCILAIASHSSPNMWSILHNVQQHRKTEINYRYRNHRKKQFQQKLVFFKHQKKQFYNDA